MTPGQIHIDATGSYRRDSVCLALVGNDRVSIQWAALAMGYEFPVNAARAIMCYPHTNLDVARNIAIAQWLRAGDELRTNWLVLVPSESMARWDFMPVAIESARTTGAPGIRVGDVYVLSRDALPKAPPYFRDGAFLGGVRDLEGFTVDLTEVYAPKPLSRAPIGESDKCIVTAIPSLGYTSLVWVAYAVQLGSPLGATRMLSIMVGYEVGEARQRLAEYVLSMRPCPRYMLFLGDDNAPPPWGLQALHDTMVERDAWAVAGLYYIKQPAPDVPVLWRNDMAGPLIPGKHFQVGDVVECDGTGLDFVLFETEALAKLPPLKFHTLVQWIPGQGMKLQTEDAFFWDRWRETHGPDRRPLVDTRVRVGHFNARDGSMY